MDCARDKPRLMAGVLEPCRSVASKGALWFVFLGSPWANWLVPRGSRRGGACHAGEARAMAAMARRIAARPQSWAAGQGRRHGDLDAADADANQRTDLEELEPDGAASRLREVGIVEADATQGAHQDVSHRVKP